MHTQPDLTSLISSYKAYAGADGVEVEAGSMAPASTTVCGVSGAFLGSYAFFNETCKHTGC